MKLLYKILCIILSIILTIFLYGCIYGYKIYFSNINYNNSVSYFVLNLERSKHRKELCINEFKKYNITNYSFIEGIDGEKYSSKFEMLVDNGYSYNFCINGTKHVGCYLSHLKTIKEFYNGKYDFGIILEDDFSFDHNPIKYIEKYMIFLTSDKPKMVVLSNTTNDRSKIIEMKNVPTWNAVGYMLNKKAANILIESLTPGSDFLNTYFKKTDCLFDFALFTIMFEKIEWKWITLISQRNYLISTITDLIRNYNFIRTEFVNASNYTFDMCNHSVNLGDSASKTFVEKLCKVKFGTNNIKGAAITIGSILTYARDNTIVWGSGFLTEKQIMKYGVKKIYSVRGPRSYDKLISAGFECPKIFGDPFFIVPLLYKIGATKKIYDIGIIPHYMEKNSKQLSDYIDNYKNRKIKIIDIQTSNIQKFIDELSECREIHSSSLHGIIISLTYNIPTCWIKLTKKTGDGFKYYDFFESLNIHDYIIGNIIQRVKRIDMTKLGIQIIRSCPFMHQDLKNIYCNNWSEIVNK